MKLTQGLLTLALFLVTGSLPPTSAWAVDDLDLDDVLGGFEEEDDTPVQEDVEPSAQPDPERFWDLTGSFALTGAYGIHHHESNTGTRYDGLTALRNQLSLQLDLDLPADWKGRVSGYGFFDAADRIRGRHHFSDDVIDEYEWDAELQETYLQGSLLRNLDLKLGRQVINWGRSDTLRVLDVLNPIDNRDPGLTDLEDLRRAVGAARLDTYFGEKGNWNLSLVVIPELRFDLNPVFGHDFYPTIDLSDLTTSLEVGLGLPAGSLASLDAGSLTLADRRPDRFGERPEWGIALGGIFSGWDFSLHVARYRTNSGQVALRPGLLSLPGPASVTLPLFEAELRYDRTTLFGLGGNYTAGAWLFKGELAWLDGMRFDTLEQVAPFVRIDTAEKSRTDLMLGVEYYGFDETVIALEVANRHINDFESRLRGFPNWAQENALEIALRVTVTLLNDRLELTALAVANGEKLQDGSFVRLSADWELFEAFEVGAGVLLFQSGEAPGFGSVGENDRLFLRARYSF
ncbi:MAG: DUF1302 domain-containing protein [bacterium]|nr:DUF1302 domain-containing protein [bacterium]